MNKIIKVDSDNLEKAILIAQDNLKNLEATPEWHKECKITFEEDHSIEKMGKHLAKIYSTREDKYEGFDDLKEFAHMVFQDDNIAEYVYEETLKSLKEDYNIFPSDIGI